MKTVVIKIGTPADCDLVIVNAEAPRGGKTSVKHRVIGARMRLILDADGFATESEPVPAQSPREVAESLAVQVNKEWMPECAQAKVKADDGSLVINCTALFSDVKFTTEVHGNGGTTATIDEF